MRKIISIGLSFALIFALTFNSFAVSDSVRQENEEKANMYHTELIVYFDNNGGMPDHFGGAYINDVNGNLVIGITDMSENVKNVYKDIVKTENIEFSLVKYSLNELFDIAKQTYTKAKMVSGMPEIIGSAIIQKENQVECYVTSKEVVKNLEISKNSQYLPSLNFDKLYHSAVSFKVSDGLTLSNSESVPLNDNLSERSVSGGMLGNGIKRTVNGSLSLVGSIGYLARYNGNVGFVTAGHSIPSEYSTAAIYNTSNTHIGNCSFTTGEVMTIPSYGDTDVAFIKLNSGVTISKTIANSGGYEQDTSIQYSIPAEGSRVYKSGYWGATSGILYSLYYVNDYTGLNGTSVRRILAEYNSQGGDSGATVFTLTGTNKARIVGIHQGSWDVHGNGTDYAVIIAAYNIQNTHGIVAGN